MSRTVDDEIRGIDAKASGRGVYIPIQRNIAIDGAAVCCRRVIAEAAHVGSKCSRYFVIGDIAGAAVAAQPAILEELGCCPIRKIADLNLGRKAEI